MRRMCTRLDHRFTQKLGGMTVVRFFSHVRRVEYTVFKQAKKYPNGLSGEIKYLTICSGLN